MMNKFRLLLLGCSLLVASISSAIAQSIPLPSEADIRSNFQRLVEFEQYARDIGAYEISAQRRQARDDWGRFVGSNFSPGQQAFLGTWDVPAPGLYRLPNSDNSRQFSPAGYAFYPSRTSDRKICVLRFTQRGVSFAVADATARGTAWQLTVSSPVLSLPTRPEDQVPFTATIIRYNLLLAEIFRSAGGDFAMSLPVSDPTALQEPEVFLRQFGIPEQDISRVRTVFNNSSCYRPDFAAPALPPPPPPPPPATGGTVLEEINTGDIVVRFAVASSSNSPIQLERDDQLLVIARIDNNSRQPVYVAMFLSAQVDGQIQGGNRFGFGRPIPIGDSRCVPLLVPRQELPDPLPQNRLFISSFTIEDIDNNPIVDSRNLGRIRVAVSPQIPNWPNGMSDFCPPPRRR